MNEIDTAMPDQWKGLINLITVPIHWIIPLQSILLDFSWQAEILSVGLLKRIFLFLPILCVITGLWCTMLSLYTLLFRSNRRNLIGMFLVLWWDAARSTWLFWAGMGKF